MKYVYLFLTAAMLACKGPQGDPGPTGAQGPVGPAGPAGTASLPKGDILGGVVLRTEFGGIEPDASGVTVALDQTALSTTSGADGSWKLAGVGIGTYQAVLSKAGFGTTRVPSIAHVGMPAPTFLFDVNLSRISTTTVSQLSVSVSGGVVTFGGQTAPVGSPGPNRYRYLRVFIGTAPQVSPTNYLTSTQFSPMTDGRLNYTLPLETVKDLYALRGGVQYYAVAYGSSLYDGYVDPMTRKMVYPALNPIASNVVPFTLP